MAWLLLVVGVLQLGVATILAIERERATTSRIPRLHYSEVELIRGYRSAGSIHLISSEGQVYRLSVLALPDSIPTAEVLRRLRSDSVATVTIRGATPRWFYGYPIVTELRTPSLHIVAGPGTPLQRVGLFGIGLGLLLLGGILLRREGERSGATRV